MICDIPCDYSEVFSPKRFNISAGAKNILINTTETVKGFSSHLKKADGNIHDIPIGTAKEISYNGKKVRSLQG